MRKLTQEDYKIIVKEMEVRAVPIMQSFLHKHKDQSEEDILTLACVGYGCAITLNNFHPEGKGIYEAMATVCLGIYDEIRSEKNARSTGTNNQGDNGKEDRLYDTNGISREVASLPSSDTTDRNEGEMGAHQLPQSNGGNKSPLLDQFGNSI